MFCISLLYFPIIGILRFTRVVLYICVMISLLLVFYVSQALFCISVLWFPYNWYFMFHKRCFVYLCSAFPIIGILCLTRVVLYICVMISLLLVFYVLFCIFVFCFPYNWYFMFHKRCFVHLCYDFPIIDILCFTRLFCISVLWFPYNLYFMFHKELFCISVLWFPYNLYFMSHKSCFVYLCSAFPIIGILCFTSVVLYICVMISP